MQSLAVVAKPAGVFCKALPELERFGAAPDPAGLFLQKKIHQITLA